MDSGILYFVTIQIPLLPEYLNVRELSQLKGIGHCMDKLLKGCPDWKDLVIRDFRVKRVSEGPHSVTMQLDDTHVVSFPRDICQGSNSSLNYQRIYRNLTKLYDSM